MIASRGTAVRSALARAAAVGAALAALACHPRQPVPLTREGEWASVRDGATRRFILYDNFDHRATATATHLSLQVREARARRLAEWNGWTEQELQASLAQERKDYAAGEEFLVAFFSADWRSTDLASPRSIWRIAVEVDGARTRTSPGSSRTSAPSTSSTACSFPGPRRASSPGSPSCSSSRARSGSCRSTSARCRRSRWTAPGSRSRGPTDHSTSPRVSTVSRSHLSSGFGKSSR